MRKTGQNPMKPGASPYDVAVEYFPKLRVSTMQRSLTRGCGRMSGVVGRGMVVSLKSFVKDLE